MELEIVTVSLISLGILVTMLSFGVPLPYIAAWYQAPTTSDRDLAWLHLRLTSIRRAPDRLKYLAGSESAMGAFINDIAPEDMAQRLRSAVSDVPIASLP